MARSCLFFILIAFVVLSSSRIQATSIYQVSCSCTKKSTDSSNKMVTVTKSTTCKAGMSKTECCTNAAKAWPSIKYCKYAKSSAGAPELGSGAGQPSNGCKPACNTTAGSQCIQTSGGLETKPACTCNTKADCTSTYFENFAPPVCQQKYSAPHSYHGNICYSN